MSIKILHKKKLDSLYKELETIPEKNKKLKSLKNKLSKTDAHDPNIYDIENKIYDLEKEIYKIKNFTNIMDYTTNVNDIIIKQHRENIDVSCNNKEGIMKYIEVKGTGGGEELLNEYLEATTQHKKNIMYVSDICESCNSKMVIIKSESMMSCTNCGDSNWFFDADVPQWSDTVEISTQFAYERVSHFKEHLNQLQGKESKRIPDEIIHSILLEMGKLRISVEKLTKTKLLNILKKLKKSHYYNNTNSIMYRITGKKPPRLPQQLEERLIVLFKAIQKPFEIYKTKDRKNFFSYSYVIHKLLLIISIKEPEVLEYIKYFPLLKSRDKLIIQDTIFKKCCKSLSWQYFPST